MKLLKAFSGATALGLLLLGVTTQSASAACQLNSPGGKVKRVVNIVFDNVHLRRDNPNVPSDMEQMPNLLNFLHDNGVISGNHHDPLISHTAHDIVTALTGVYGDRNGIPVANSYGYFKPDGSVGFNSSFLYWTAVAADGKPEMLDEFGKTAPAPWVAYTRAGCDVGAFSVANIEFERLPDDVTTFYGAGSTVDTTVRGELASSDPATQQKPSTDYLGIAVHCAIGSPLCNSAKNAPFAAADPLPDEPGGYTGFKGLFGNINVQPVISPSGPVQDLDGNVIADKFGHPGFPNGFSPLATQSLGYAATMLEAGVQVIYVYIADAHDNRFGSGTFGPGEAGYVAQLKEYDTAFGKFFARLAADGITKDNTLFVVTPDENDHFVGGPPSPANCDGVTTPCTYAIKGEIDTSIDRLLITQRANATPFLVHSDDAPTIYITGNPSQLEPVTRTLEHDLDALTAKNPITGKQDKLSQLLADRAEMKLLHMLTASPARAPTLTMFGNDNYFFQTVKPPATACQQQSDCVVVGPNFAWNHGDYQQEITRTWVAIAGPGVQRLGRDDAVFTDHADVRPTIMALLGLKDDYVHEGRVVAEWMQPQALPSGIAKAQANFTELATVFKQLDAPVGDLGRASLVWANKSITGTNQTYLAYLKQIDGIIQQRQDLAFKIKNTLHAAAFAGQPVDLGTVDSLGNQAQDLINKVNTLAEGASN